MTVEQDNKVRKNTLIVALINLDKINNTHKIDKRKCKSTKPSTIPHLSVIRHQE